MARTIGSAEREVARYSTGLWQDNGSFPGLERNLGIDARGLSHIFGEDSNDGSIRRYRGSVDGDMMGSMLEPMDDKSLLRQIASVAHDEAISATIDAMSVDRIL